MDGEKQCSKRMQAAAVTNAKLLGRAAGAKGQRRGHRRPGAADLPLLPVIKAKSGRYSLVGLEQDDFIQEGLIGLFNAVKNYDPARGASFDTYARRCIHSRMVECLSASLAQKHLPLRDYLPIDSLEHAAGPDSDGDPLEVYLQQEEELLRRQKIKTLLSGLEQETLTLYLSGLSYEEMAQRLHCSTKAVDNALQRVRRKLRNSSR